MEQHLDDRYIDQLQKACPSDWPNIPAPVMSAFNMVIKTFSHQHSFFITLDSYVQSVNEKAEVKTQNLKKSLIELQQKLIQTDQKNRVALDLLQDHINKKLLRFKGEMNGDIDQKLASQQKKFLQFQEQIFNLSKKLQTFPTHKFIEQKITQNSKQLSKQITHQIVSSYINPQIYQIQQKIDKVALDTRAELTRALRPIDLKISQVKENLLEELESAKKQLKQFSVKEIIPVNQRIDEILTMFDPIHSKIEELHTTALNQISQSKLEFDQKFSQNSQTITEKFAQYQKKFNPINKRINNLKQAIQQRIKQIKQIKDSSFQMISRIQRIQLTQQTTNLQLTKLAAPPAPPSDPQVPQVEEISQQIQPPPAIPQVSLDSVYQQIAKQISSARQQFDQKIQSQYTKIIQIIDSSVEPIKIEMYRGKELVQKTIMDLKHKLAWLPLSLNTLEGMDPTEARLFTIEARLRSEENLRIKIQRDVTKIFQTMSSNQS